MSSFHFYETYQQVVPYLIDILGGPKLVTASRKQLTDPSIPPITGSGALSCDTSLVAQIEDIDNTFSKILFERHSCPFSKLEEMFISHIFTSLSALLKQPKESYSVHYRAILAASVIDIAVACLLRGDPRKCAYIHNILRVMKELTLHTYEGHPCTSGFIFVSKPYKGWLDKFTDIGFTVLPLKPNIRVTTRFFDSPLAYRYINGQQAAYIVQVPALCVSILHMNSNSIITKEDIATHGHFRSALVAAGPQTFGLFVNQNSELDVLTNIANGFSFIKDEHFYK